MLRIRVSRGLAAIAVAIAGAIAIASPAPANVGDVGPMAIICDNPGEKWFYWSSITQPNKVTHRRTIENYGYTDLVQDYNIYWQTTIGAEYTASGQVSVSGSVVIASLDAQVSASLKVYGSQTYGGNITMHITVPAQHIVVGYSGTKTAKGNYTYYYCNPGNNYLYKTTGNAQSWVSAVDGVVDCVAGPPSGSLAYLAKQQGC